jgi:hypothetical protein
VSAQIAKGIELDLWEELSAEDAANFEECSIIEAAFAATVGKLALSDHEKSIIRDDSATVHDDIPAYNSLAAERAQAFVTRLESLPRAGARAGPPLSVNSPQSHARPSVDKATVAREWAAQGGGTKRRLCVAHNRFLNECSRGWPVSFTTPAAILETSRPGDVFIVRDHKGGYNAIPIRPDHRRYFCFFHPVTGRILRCKRLDFGWALSPGIFCCFTAEINAIISSRVASSVHPRALSRYYVDDSNTRVPRGGGPPHAAPLEAGTDLFARAQSANESKAMAILVEIQKRANFLTAPEKDNLGETLPYLGVVISSATRSAVVVPSKIFKTLTMLHVLLRCAQSAVAIAVPRSFALKAAGNAQWLGQNFRLGRLHTPALWLAAELLRNRSPPPLLSCPGLVAALQWWTATAAAGRLLPHRFVEAVDIPSLAVYFTEATTRAALSGVAFALPLALPHSGASRRVVALLHDASGELEHGAVGGCWRAQGEPSVSAFYYQLTPEERAWPSIAPKELRALVEWLERFGSMYEGAVLLAGTDNAGNVFTVNRLRVDASDAVMAGLLARLLASADRWGIDGIVWWCPRALNGISDALSKSLTLADARRLTRDLGVVLLEVGDGHPAVPF